MIRRTANPRQQDRDTVGIVVEMVARFYGMTPEIITGDRRTKPVVQARWMAMLLAYELTACPVDQLAAWLGKDPTTCLDALGKVRARIKSGDETLAAEHEVLQRQLRYRLLHIAPAAPTFRAREVSEEFAKALAPHLAKVRSQLSALHPTIREAITQAVELTCVGIAHQVTALCASLAALTAHANADAERDPLGAYARLLDLQGCRGAAETKQAPTPTIPSPREIINGHEEDGPREAAGAAGAAIAGGS
jgi:hypothetical protein